MASFGEDSRIKLSTCHPYIQEIMHEIIKHFDFKVLWGFRTEAEQDTLYPAFTTKRWPHSKHNTTPSSAIDIAPYPIDWNDKERFYYLAGYIMREALVQNVRLRWGGDWDRDTEVQDQSFFDLGHFELLL